MKVVAVIVAGGVGRRLKTKVHKPFVRLSGRPLLARTLEAFEKTAGVNGIVLVIHPNDEQAARRLIRSSGFRKIIQIVHGGATRMASVSCGLKAVPSETQWVAVHDGARPLVTPKLIEATIRAAKRFKAAIAAVPVVPTVKQAAGGWVTKTLDRKILWAVQTPQVFERRLLERAHRLGGRNGIAATDDAALVEGLGHRVRIVLGSHRNIKVTAPEDLIIAQALLKAEKIRT